MAYRREISPIIAARNAADQPELALEPNTYPSLCRIGCARRCVFV
jgi:hypothetical protein